MEQPKKVDHRRALNCSLINQLATPGLGSIIGGRIAAGIGQLALALTGFGLVLVWFFMTLGQYYRQMDSDAPVKSYARFGIAGGIVFAVSWVWALFTSVSLLRTAEGAVVIEPTRIPPRISEPPPEKSGPSA